jgi:hypothetical protein
MKGLRAGKGRKAIDRFLDIFVVFFFVFQCFKHRLCIDFVDYPNICGHFGVGFRAGKWGVEQIV